MADKWSLHIGINNYPGSYNDLSGCVNDAVDWAKLCNREGYTTMVITDEQATKSQVTLLINQLTAKLGWGDRLVVTFSGHGTWVPDLDGDEVDGRDEALCLYDFESGGLLTDDEIAKLFGNLSFGARVLMVSDSCHSGTVARTLDMNNGRSGARFISPSAFTDMTVTEARNLESKYVPSKSRTMASLMSGCADNEYSWDASFDGRPNGAFTAAALRTYEPGITLSRWHKKIREILPSEIYPQTPQLSAAPYRRYSKAL